MDVVLLIPPSQMPFVKKVKSDAYFSRFQVKYRRRREGKTDCILLRLTQRARILISCARLRPQTASVAGKKQVVSPHSRTLEVLAEVYTQ